MKLQILPRSARLAVWTAAVLATAGSQFAQTTSLVRLENGRLVYTPTSTGDVIPDYSGVGYRNSEAPIPQMSDFPYVTELTPGSGDRAGDLRAAIQRVADKPLVNGLRGVVLLKPGRYEIKSTVRVNVSGILIMGSGTGSGGTTIDYTATTQTNCIEFQGSGGVQVNSGTRVRIQGSYIPYGTKKITVPAGHSFETGDWVRIEYAFNDDWIKFVKMDSSKLGSEAWTTSGTRYNIERQIKLREGNVLHLDAPLMDPVDEDYATANIVKITGSGRIENVGIENIRFNSAYDGGSVQHGWKAVTFDSVKNGWARRIDAYYFGYATISIGSERAIFITVDDCLYSEPKGAYDTGRRYSFDNNGQRNLFKNCRAEKGGRHDFVTGSWTPGPSVFLNCVATGSLSDSGPHHRWSAGHLYDNVKSDYSIRVRNRGNAGTGHGWAGSQTMLWNCADTGGSQSSVIQDIPGTFTNWAIGFVGSIDEGDDGEPVGVIQSKGVRIAAIPSLFEAQLRDRLNGTQPPPPPPTQTASPVFSPAGGSFVGSVNVSITSATTGATIRYTLDGSTPSTTSGVIYTTPVMINASSTLKAIAYASGSTASTVTTANYTITSAGILVTGVTVTPDTIALEAGANGSLTATVSPANATNKTVTWTSSAEAIATVNASGVVSAVAAGTATITAKTVDGGFTDSTTVTVTASSETATPITVPFIKDGAGDFYWAAPTSGFAFINCWNLQKLEINGVDYTNKYVARTDLPAPINGKYYIRYSGAFAWSHLEIK
jgi:hypothetical protein